MVKTWDPLLTEVGPTARGIGHVLGDSSAILSFFDIDTTNFLIWPQAAQ